LALDIPLKKYSNYYFAMHRSAESVISLIKYVCDFYLAYAITLTVHIDNPGKVTRARLTSWKASEPRSTLVAVLSSISFLADAVS
jgi:hypothetical protein